MTPDLYLRRGLQYTFKIEGGNNAASAEFYHPFIITDEPVGGYNRLTKEQKSKVFVIAMAMMVVNRIIGMVAKMTSSTQDSDALMKRSMTVMNLFENTTVMATW